ncbi:MAG: hypothetical protein R3C32_01485 [Chloroflexota bacterium]
MPSTLSTVNATFLGRDRAAMRVLVWGSVIARMAAVGPAARCGWRDHQLLMALDLLVNLPVGVVITVGIALFVPETRGRGFAPGTDVDGFLLSSIGLAALVFGLVEGRTYGWFVEAREFAVGDLVWPTTAPISLPAASLALGLACLVLFVLWERHRAQVERLDPARHRPVRVPLPSAGATSRRCSSRWASSELAVHAAALPAKNVLGLSALGSGAVIRNDGRGRVPGRWRRVGSPAASARQPSPRWVLPSRPAPARGRGPSRATQRSRPALLLVGYGAGCPECRPPS